MENPSLPHYHGEEPAHTEVVRQMLEKEDTFQELSDIFRQLGDANRIRIFWLLCHCEECVVNIAAMMDMSSPAVSHHLRILRDSGLLTTRRDGKEVYYHAADTAQARLLHELIEQVMDVACPQWRAEAEQVRLIREIHDYLLSHMDQRITIEGLCHLYPINPTTLKEVFKDVYGLTWRMVTDGHIRYRRSKTDVSIDVEIVPELEEIMKRYHREDSPFVFPFLHEARKGCPGKELPEESALRRINRTARMIGRKVGLSVPLTTYVLRHTWATLMLEDSQPVELISQCMGHTSIRTTQIYLSRISSRKVDTAVDGMYDRMLRKPKHKRKERDIPSGCHRKSESGSPQPMENGNTHPHVSQTPENEKCPFLSKKETFVSCHVNTVIFFAAKVYISYICSKFSSAFFSVSPDISSCLSALYSFHAM